MQNVGVEWMDFHEKMVTVVCNLLILKSSINTLFCVELHRRGE